MKHRVLGLLNINDIRTAEEFADAVEKWNWQESNPKFIINSVRVYEFWEYDWYLPFVDKEFMDYWKCVPLCLRYKKKMYDETVDALFFELTGETPPCHDKNTNIHSFKNKLQDKLRYTWLHHVYLNIGFIFKKKRMHKYWDTNGKFGIFDEFVFNKYSFYLGNMNFLMSLDFLRKKDILVEVKL